MDVIRLRDWMALTLFDIAQRMSGGQNWCFDPGRWYVEADKVIAEMRTRRDELDVEP